MKNYRSFAALFVLVLLFTSVSAGPPKKIKILLVTGGHGFQHKPFYNIFDSLPGITYDTLTQPKGNELIATAAVDKYDVLVFYDMPDSITVPQQEAYIRLLQKGKAMIFLHHAIVSYQNWKTFKSILGGKYYTKECREPHDSFPSNYAHDIIIPVKVERQHPVTRGIPDFDINDEVYNGCEILPSITPLLSTTHPQSNHYLAWINHYGNSDVLYIQLGHGGEAYLNPYYRKMLLQGIEWSANRHKQ